MKITLSKKNLKQLSSQRREINPQETPKVAGGVSVLAPCHTGPAGSCVWSVCTLIGCP